VKFSDLLEYKKVLGIKKLLKNIFSVFVLSSDGCLEQFSKLSDGYLDELFLQIAHQPSSETKDQLLVDLFVFLNNVYRLFTNLWRPVL